MNKKFLALTLVVFFLTGLTMAQSVQIESSSKFPNTLTGGESFELSLDYSVNTGREVPLVLDLKVSNDKVEVSEEAFTLSVDEGSCEGFECNLPDSNEDGSVTLDVVSNSRLKPGSYNFSLDLLSSVGLGESTVSRELNAEQPIEFGGGRSRVTVEVSEDGKANVTELDFVGTNPPSSNSRFIGGVEVEVRNNNGKNIGDKASGTVRVNFDESDVEGLERDSLTVYFYNDSVSEWEAMDSTVGQNYVEAEVEHFSVYSVFGREESDSSSTIDAGSGSIGGSSVDQPEDNNGEPSEEEPETGEETSQENPEDETSEEPNNSEVEEEPELPEIDGARGQGLTGQFTEAVSNPLTGVLAVLVMIIGYLFYSDYHRRIADRLQSFR